jgi:hypothetical protein
LNLLFPEMEVLVLKNKVIHASIEVDYYNIIGVHVYGLETQNKLLRVCFVGTNLTKNTIILITITVRLSSLWII